METLNIDVILSDQELNVLKHYCKEWGVKPCYYIRMALRDALRRDERSIPLGSGGRPRDGERSED